MLTLIAWALVLTVAFNYFNAYNRNAANKTSSHEIKYSEMVTMIEKDQVDEVLFKDSTIYITPVDGYVYTEEVTSGGKTETKTYKQSEDSSLTLYTAYLSNADLLPLMKEHNVAYTGFYEAEMSPFLMIMIQYILPTIFIVGAFMLVMRLMSKSGGGGFGGIGSVGKSNAKVYMEKSTGVTFKDVAGQDEAKESPGGDHRLPAQPRQIHRHRRQAAQGRAAGGLSRYRQDAAGQGRGRRGRGAVLLHLRLRLCGDVRGRGRQPCPRPVQGGRQGRALHHLYRRDRHHRQVPRRQQVRRRQR